MLKNVFLLYCFFLSISVSVKSEENYIDYQREITKAENMMFDSLFTESVAQYRKTFDAYSFNFPRDCMVAAQVAAAFTQDDTSAFYFLRKAVRFGARIEFIRTITPIKKLRKLDLWEVFLGEYDSIRMEYLAGINIPYRDLCQEYRLKDKVLRDKDQAPLVNRYIVLNPWVRKKWMKNCRETLDAMDTLIPLYGFPSYRTIGTVDSVTAVNRILSACQILIIYYHYAPIGKAGKYFPGLLEEVKKGNLVARDYATLLEFDRRAQKKYTRDSSLYYVRWEVFPDPDRTYANEEEINRRREEIGLSTCYYERVRKTWQHAYYQRKENSIDFLYYSF